jgi:MFS transporter, PAT family, beta-lactamase induction signal transducer AmpG
VKLNKKLIIICLLYFAEGFPFGIIHQTFSVYFRANDMSIENVGLLSLLTLPYALKFLWAPAVDFIGKRRYWIAATQILMAAFLVCVLPLDPRTPGILLWGAMGFVAFFAATQDIAIDAYSIEMLKPSEMGLANGFRMAAWRVAFLLSGSWFIALAGYVGWQLTFFTAAGVLVICSVISLRLPPFEVTRPAVSLSNLVGPVRELLSRPGVFHVAAFILLYKLGDIAIGPMVTAFWVDSGLPLEKIGLITGTFGFVAAIAGGLAGGLFMSRYGIFHGLWVLGLCQPLGNVVYALAAAFPETGEMGIYAASITESFASGMGTAAFLAFLMSICKKEYSATQYAWLSALFRMPGIAFGSISGYLTASMGYAHYFILTLIMSFPVFIFIFHAKAWIPTNNEMAEQEAEQEEALQDGDAGSPGVKTSSSGS